MTGSRLRSFSANRSGVSMLVTVAVLLAFTVGACVAEPEQLASASSEQKSESGGLGHEMLNAVLWQATSAEHKAIALQTYALAGRNLDTAIADPTWTAALEQTERFETLPAAIILDIDETVLDNSPYNVQVVSQLREYSRKSFKDWCLKAEAPAVPGVQAFLTGAVKKRVSVFYVSARTEDLRTCTIENLRHLDLPVADEESSILLDVGDSKSDERRRVAETHRILLLIGDNLNDFVDGSRATPKQRSILARRYAKKWGNAWIILPNPMYGHWEDTFHGFDYDLPRAAKLQSKQQGLTIGLKK